MRFFKSENGYVLTIALLFVPVFLIVALLVIDLGRANNHHSDLQAAADALALAGARELDGGTDAITRAEAAMQKLVNSASFRSPDNEEDFDRLTLTSVSSGDDDFVVIFLSAIPASDDTPINQAWVDSNRATGGGDAQYVYVRTQTERFLAFFASALETVTGQITISATAVASSRASACDVTPLYICNPFEDEPEGVDLQGAFAQGRLHGRLVKLHPPGSSTAGPGNFGFLQTSDSASAAAIRAFFAGAYVPECYDASTVETKPGAAVSIRTGINIRFDIYDAPFKNGADLYPPAYNVRKGYQHQNIGGAGAQPCKKQELPDPLDPSQFLGFPENATMAQPGSGVLGASIGSGDWDLVSYWNVNHANNDPADPAYVDPTSPGEVTALYDAIGNSMPGATSPGADMPSRYDVYRHEIEESLALNNLVGDLSPGGETGAPICSATQSGALPPPDPSINALQKDRRVLFAAIVDCLANPHNGASTLPVNSFASIFMASPMEKNSSDDSTIDVEFIDITGYGGNGTLDAFIRREVFLVR